MAKSPPVTLPLVTLSIDSIVLDPNTGTATFTLAADDRPAAPTDLGQWFPGPGSKLSFDLPIKKKDLGTLVTYTGIAAREVDGETVYTRYDFIDDTWQEIERVYPDGTSFMRQDRVEAKPAKKK